MSVVKNVQNYLIFIFYLQNRLIQTGQTGGQQYSDTSPFSIPWSEHRFIRTLQHNRGENLRLLLYKYVLRIKYFAFILAN